MDLLKTQFDRIQQQLAGLSATQKMLAACLVVIIVMTISWWGRYAAVPEMEPVVDRALAPEDLAVVRRQLKSSGIPAEVSSDGKVLVPADRVAEAIADLTFSQALPKSSRIDFQSLLKDMSPFTSESTTQAQFNNYNQVRLAEVISNFPDVQSAQVFIDPTEKVRMGGGVQPSATVSIEMKRGAKASQRVVDAAAHFIAHSHAGLSWKQVAVIVDGILQRVRDPDSDAGIGGAEHLEIVERYQNSVEERVSRFLSIPQLSVSVSFRVSSETKRTRIHSFDDKNVIQKETETDERTSETSTPQGPAGGEPGALPNTGMTIGTGAVAGAGGDATSNETQSKTKMHVYVGDKTQEVMTPPGVGEPVAAAVRLPRSYIANVIKQEKSGQNPNPPEPDEQAIQARFDRELKEIRGAVKRVVGLDSEDAVLVSMYTDLLPPAGAAAAAMAGVAPGISTASFAALAGAHSRDIVLGGLAAVSLFMVSMMVRRSSPLPVTVSAPAPAMPMPVLDATEGLAGEVGEGKSMLDAMELDDDAVRAQQMLDQVSSMVEENPDAAAGLVKRWLNRA